MLSKKILQEIVRKQKAECHILKDTVRRDILDDILKWFRDKRIIILTGIRRCGKSTILKQLICTKGRFCYVNFEDERFIDFTTQHFNQLNEVLIKEYDNPNVYFFDEIQNIDKFELFVRRLHDEGKKVIITGSNAALLSKELGTRLTGRYKAFEVFPFSFTEFLRFKKIKPSKKLIGSLEKQHTLTRLFDEYLAIGGFPEYLTNQDDEYIRMVYENILYRDIITRYSIKKHRIIKELVNILTTNITLPITYNSLKKSLGLANAITVKEYISYLNNSYMFFELQKFDFSIIRQLNAPKKIYLIDPAFNNICGLNFSPNEGRILENAVFIELKRKKIEPYYYSGDKECDFVIKKGTKVTNAIQVCFDLNEDNKDREIKGLLEAMDRFNLKDGLLLTNNQEDEFVIESKKVIVKPTWKWILKKP